MLSESTNSMQQKANKDNRSSSNVMCIIRRELRVSTSSRARAASDGRAALTEIDLMGSRSIKEPIPRETPKSIQCIPTHSKASSRARKKRSRYDPCRSLCVIDGVSMIRCRHFKINKSTPGVLSWRILVDDS